jgi:hypothetical protein
MRKSFVLLLFIFTSIISTAQEVTFADSVYTKRWFLKTDVYRNNNFLDRKQVLDVYKGNKQATIKFKWGRAMRPLGIPVAIGGVALGVIAIKGEDKIAVIDGKEYPYVVRSLPKLLIGLGLFVAGGCIIESSNELVANSANKYNEALGKRKKSTTTKTTYFGITNDGVSIGMKF